MPLDVNINKHTMEVIKYTSYLSYYEKNIFTNVSCDIDKNI